MNEADSLILIYQMGKVGSSSMAKSIPNALHIHNIMRKAPKDYISPVRAKIEFRGRRKWRRWLKLQLLHQKTMRAEKVKIITLVRDPVDRDLSMFFQALPFWLSETYLAGDFSRTESANVLQIAFYNHLNHDYALNWFDAELKPLSGVDVYATEFDSDIGFKRYQNNQFEVLLIRHDKLNSVSTVQELSDFVGCTVRLEGTNRAEGKWYAPVRKHFLEEFVPRSEYLDYMYKSKLARHFFSKNEIEELRKKHSRMALRKPALEN